MKISVDEIMETADGRTAGWTEPDVPYAAASEGGPQVEAQDTHRETADGPERDIVLPSEEKDGPESDRLPEETIRRLRQEKEELNKEKERLLREQEQFLKEIRERQGELDFQERRLSEAQKSLKKDELFFQQKMEILKSGFAQLADDRKALERERIRLETKQEEMSERSRYGNDSIRLFFSGVSNPLTLKKRYRDLIKIFHPDNLCGDTKLLQQINQTYEILLEEVGWQKKA